jgi:hypothetical protein
MNRNIYYALTIVVFGIVGFVLGQYTGGETALLGVIAGCLIVMVANETITDRR